MPTILRGNAAASQLPQSLEMETRAESRDRSKSTGFDGRNEESVAQKRAGSQKKFDKQSLDYVLRSGLAGGLAGCAVSQSPWT